MDYAKECQDEDIPKQLTELAKDIPEIWKRYAKQGHLIIEKQQGQKFIQTIADILANKNPTLQPDPKELEAFFSWIAHESEYRHLIDNNVCHWLAGHLAKNLNGALAHALSSNASVSAPAFRTTLLRLQSQTLRDLMSLHEQIKGGFTQVIGGQKAQQEDIKKLAAAHEKIADAQERIAQAQEIFSSQYRLASYKRSLVAAFKPYQELALDHFAAADDSAPDIWDIFVHPAASEEYLRPEDMDVAQRETPPRLPAKDLLPILNSDECRRHVLLADPGMGKSTLIQALIAHLASGLPLTGAPALTGLLPVPFILRDLVPLLPQDQPENWTWDSIVQVFFKEYRREENAPPLCDAFREHEQEFRDLIQKSESVFFLIDGIDEIGDVHKRREIVRCLQEGISAVCVKARWLITSRIIGYEEAAVDWVNVPNREEIWLFARVVRAYWCNNGVFGGLG